ncbi:MAG: helix-turn-helix domain-containing protein [Acidimicrobiia bacterium]|nr:helix-turn-helix domain-containing protein [Acidimicrobiia bacterium]
MARRGPSPKQIALWRFDVIECLLDRDLSKNQMSRLILQISRTPLRWPDGSDGRPGRATLYRWRKAYHDKGFDGLKPQPRRDRGRKKVRLPASVVEAALNALQEDPLQPWTFLCVVLSVEFKDVKIPRSTLYRRVTDDPGYRPIALARRASKQPARRTRFVACRRHQRWQCDAKGPFDVLLTDGNVIKVHVITILEDLSRAVLAVLAVTRLNHGAAVKVFRKAAERWGLAEEYYADKGSIFDTPAFRSGLAQLGCRRLPTKPGNPQAHGKIEAYHRPLSLWFVRRLKVQKVIDLVHLNQLLEAMIAMLYQPHHHRGLKESPADALAGTVSARQVARTQLYEVFLDEKHLKSNRVTGEVDIQGHTWLVPDALRGQRALFLIDPARDWEPVVVEPGTDRRLPLRRAQIQGKDAPDEPARWGEGPLQKLHDHWAGKKRPLADAGFGLPEIYRLLADSVGRHVPQSQREAVQIQRFYQTHGPLPGQATAKAFQSIGRELGPGHALALYLDALAARLNQLNRRKDP